MSNSRNLFWSCRLGWVQLVLTTDWRSAFLNLASRIWTTHWVNLCILCGSCAMLLFTVQARSIFDMVRLWCLSLAKWFHQLFFSFVWKSRTILALSLFYIQEWGHSSALSLLSCHTLQCLVLPETPCCFSIQRICGWLAPPFSEEAPIWRMPRIWHLPSQVGGMYVCSFWNIRSPLVHYLVGLWWWCYWGDS